MPVVNKPKYAVEDLTIDEVALVDDGDNPKANIVLFKLGRPAQERDDGKEYGWQPRSTAEILAQRRFMEAFYDVRSAYVEAINNVLSMVPAGEMGALLEKSTDEFVAEVASISDPIAKNHPGLAEHVNKLVQATKSAASTGEGEAITKALEAFGVTPQEETMPVPNPTKSATALTLDAVLAALPEDQRALVKAKLDEQNEAATTAAKAKAEADAKASADAVQAQLKASEDRIKAAEAEVAKMKDEKATEEFRAKARSIGTGDVEDMTSILKGAYGRSKEEGERVEKTLRAMSAQAKKGEKALLKVVGTSNTEGTDPEADPLDAKAKEIQAAEKVTYQRAYELAGERFPELEEAAYAKSSQA